MRIKIHELALKEYNDAIRWYEQQSKGLGKKFNKAVNIQLKKIKKNPGWFLKESDNIYKAYIPKFPYKILFTIEDDDLIVLWAFAHMHRKPNYWQSRKI
ncbi:type II toxin-antitoxin system RelE/ParE family toxin [bacterium]|nr:type II toxin-antitoxin system RelE/ParE family toxin [bacterium]